MSKGTEAMEQLHRIHTVAVSRVQDELQEGKMEALVAPSIILLNITKSIDILTRLNEPWREGK